MPPAYRYSPARRRSRGGAGGGVAVALGFVAFIFVCGIVFTKMFSTGSTTPSPGSPVASSSPGAPGAGQAAPGGGPSSGTTSAGGSSGTQAAAASRLYGIGSLTGYGCRGRAIAPGVSSSFAGFLNATTDCLDQSWSSAFRQAGIPFSPPIRVFWTRPGRSPCGDYPAPGAAAFYCPLNHGMYIGVTHAQQAAAGLPVRYNVAYAREVAHEYGHHVQGEAGILDYSHEARTQAPTIEQRNAITRRSELQAQCFSGMFFAGSYPRGSVDGNILQEARSTENRGDHNAGEPRDHGTDQHASSWWEQGAQKNRTYQCNTWMANAADVA